MISDVLLHFANYSINACTKSQEIRHGTLCLNCFDTILTVYAVVKIDLHSEVAGFMFDGWQPVNETLERFWLYFVEDIK